MTTTRSWWTPMPPRTELDLPIRIDRGAREPVHRQLADALRRAIREGALAPGARLPSTRALAETLGIARNVALVAFDELYAEGYVEGRPGSGTYVARDLPAVPRAAVRGAATPERWAARSVAAPLEVPDPPGCI